LIKDYIARWGLWEDFKINESDMKIKYLPNRNEMLFVGMDDPERIKSIENITSIWYEEASEADYEDMLQLDVRLRPQFALKEKHIQAKARGEFVGDYSQICTSYNPISKLNWTYAENYIPGTPSYSKKVISNLVINFKKVTFTAWKTVVHSTYKDNRFLPIENAAALEALASKDEAFYKIYALGEYADLKNKIYNNYSLINKIPELEWDYHYFGLDFGYNHPMAMAEVFQKGDDVYIKQRYYEREQTNSDLIEWMKRDGKIPTDVNIYGDSANPDKVEEISRAGFSCTGAYKAKESVKNGIDHIKTLNIYVLKDDIDLLKELYSYKWKEIIDKESGKKQVLDEPVKMLDDLMDAMRYTIYTFYIEYGNMPEFYELNI